MHRTYFAESYIVFFFFTLNLPSCCQMKQSLTISRIVVLFWRVVNNQVLTVSWCVRTSEILRYLMSGLGLRNRKITVTSIDVELESVEDQRKLRQFCCFVDPVRMNPYALITWVNLKQQNRLQPNYKGSVFISVIPHKKRIRFWTYIHRFK